MTRKKALILQNGWWNDIVDIVLKNTDWDIEYAFVNSYEDEARLQDERIKNIYVLEDAVMWVKEKDTHNLSYDDIAKYKYLEADFYDGTSRYINDYNLTKVLFYNSLAYWLKLFNEHHFDLIIVQENLHGIFNDLVPIALAKERKIPCYQLEPAMFGKCGIYLNNTDEYVQLLEPSGERLESAMHYSFDENMGFTYSKSRWRHYTKSILLKVGGAIFTRSLMTFLYKRTIYNYVFNLSYTKHTVFSLWRAYWIFNQGQKHMRKLSTDVSIDEKYVVYYLHFEPEASILVRCPIKTQLLAIQMLAENLPPGWKLYVKEHPHQSNMNAIKWWDFLVTIHHYKTKKFYDYIVALPNTYLVKPEVSSEKLTANAMAIASYHGTVAIESLKYKKPVLLFAGNKSVMRYTNAIFSIRSSADCAEAFAEISAGYTRDNEDYNAITSRYLVSRSVEGMELIIKSIDKHCKNAERK